MDIDTQHAEEAAFQKWFDEDRLKSLKRAYGADATIAQHPNWSTGFEGHMKLAWMARAEAAHTQTPTDADIHSVCAEAAAAHYQLTISVHAQNPQHAKDFATELQDMVDEKLGERGEDVPQLGVLSAVTEKASSVFQLLRGPDVETGSFTGALNEPKPVDLKPVGHIGHVHPASALSQSIDEYERRMARGTEPKD